MCTDRSSLHCSVYYLVYIVSAKQSAYREREFIARYLFRVNLVDRRPWWTGLWNVLFFCPLEKGQTKAADLSLRAVCSSSGWNCTRCSRRPSFRKATLSRFYPSLVHRIDHRLSLIYHRTDVFRYLNLLSMNNSLNRQTDASVFPLNVPHFSYLAREMSNTILSRRIQQPPTKDRRLHRYIYKQGSESNFKGDAPPDRYLIDGPGVCTAALHTLFFPW